MYDRLLLPTDMSPGIDQAIDHAIDAAQRYDAELHVLYVVDAEAYSSYPGDEYVHEFEGLESALEQAGRDAVEDLTERAETSNVETNSIIRHGVPHEEILQYMDEADIGLTVVGSKNRSGEYRRLLGSVAERVANMAERPVTIVKTPVEE
ncbi:Nucleotide-binding universal stress protein, UspA family [Natronorubrum sediminis]|uniref:Nucleotide-binding universal stress protein, UspA family n=1 Tax=Natronorubrum sediminis TaxID=640943 RepID=A0A1H6FW88_9EURY|nr:universal stress protein [Natronorubrum sediminis]SEH15047.1 Nucleotide-binding universal stress protein, UspA family [Natronorubrum sediminis]